MRQATKKQNKRNKTEKHCSVYLRFDLPNSLLCRFRKRYQLSRKGSCVLCRLPRGLRSFPFVFLFFFFLVSFPFCRSLVLISTLSLQSGSRTAKCGSRYSELGKDRMKKKRRTAEKRTNASSKCKACFVSAFFFLFHNAALHFNSGIPLQDSFFRVLYFISLLVANVFRIQGASRVGVIL